ncbi:BMP family ABC transporter substrate-binding protein [Carboxydochorda subterranea]|uniref:BMP family ABC transporter substrate-binding protein n=1 Tax=Carboxydichorda subterranea TaxID=3109565 RepID=A0ABZ1BYW6_9FIRM|nr:BMP family ABC transporter substrate-binding protein [Limnochorda sp. L945t]WRP17916.1 BMP family ABC transporter substrate-binding protein [Limnochorda sp. L945t]
MSEWRSRWTRMAGLGLLALALVTAGTAPGATAEAPKRVAYVINGSLGDQSFYDSGYEGLKRIEKEFGVETRVVEAKFTPSLYYPSLQQAARWADVVFVISYGMEDQLQQIADQNPNKVFVNVDTVVTNSKKTISSIDFRESEGAFMAGVVAAMMTTYTKLPGINPQKVIGAVGGDDDPVIRDFVYGYEQGAHYVDPEVKVQTVYVGSWDDPVKGKQAALQLFAQGADVVFNIAALTGVGVLQAAREAGKYAIGVDTNQNGLEPGHVLTSDIKDVGGSMYQVFRMIRDGTYKPGTVYSFGLKERAVGLAIDDHSRQLIPAGYLQRIEAIRQKVISGEIEVKPYRP